MNNFGEQFIDPKDLKANVIDQPENKEELNITVDNKNELENDISSGYLNDLNSQINLEEHVIEEFSKTKDDKLRESLRDLRRLGEESLKTLSSKIVEIFNSSKLVVKLRDIYIEKRSISIHKELSVENKLPKVDDYDSFLKLIQSDFWGSSANAADATFRANTALYSIAKRFPEKRKDILEIWPELFSREISCNTDLFDRQIRDIKENEYNVISGNDEKINYIKSCDDFTALTCLLNLNFSSKDIDVSEETIKRLDSLISNHPNVKELPGGITDQLFNACTEKPEEIMSDARRTDFLFNLWINKISIYSNKLTSSSIIPIFAERLQTCSKEETDKLLKMLLRNWNNSYDSGDFNLLIEFLPLDKSHVKLINKKKNLVDGENSDKLLSLNRDKVLGKNIEKREYEVLLTAAESLRGGNEVIFLSNLIANYPDKVLGINETELENILDVLLKYRQERFDIDTLHCLTELMSRCYWPDNLKKKVYGANSISANTLNKIVTGLDDPTFDWLRNNQLLFSQLQIDFHKKAQNNDLRHYFYNVLDGKQQSDNLGDLIKSYGRSGAGFDFEELRALFLENRIDKKYIQYFIDQIGNEQILTGLNSELINSVDKTWFLESALKYGKANNATEILRMLMLGGSIDNQEKRQDILNSLSDNILLKCDNYDSKKTAYGYGNEVAGVSAQLFNEDLSDILSREELLGLRKKMMLGALGFSNSENATLLTITNRENTAKAFPEEQERADYLYKLFEKLISDQDNRQYFSVMSFYFGKPELFSALDNSRKQELENKIFNFNITERSDSFLGLLPEMDAKQKERFISCFENNFELKELTTNVFDSFCRKLTYFSEFSSNKEVYTRIYLKLLNDPGLKSEAASVLFDKEIVFSDSKIKDAFFNNIIRWPGIDGTNILESLASMKGNDKSFLLSNEEVKKISTSVMENRGLSPKFWKGYLQSPKKNPTFYLDENIFRKGINNIGNDCFRESGEEIVAFIKSLSASGFEFTGDDAQAIVRKAFENTRKIDNLEAFYKYDQVLMENILTEKNYFSYSLDANISYSKEYNYKLLDNIVNNNFSLNDVNKLLDYLKKNGNLEMVNEFKKRLSKLDKEQATAGRMALLNADFLSVVESKKFYQEITSSSSDNARIQIMNSIDVIGSMLSNRNNVEQLGQFLNKPRAEDILNLKDISDFIEKYNKENKGRSVAVMLFAREYLPSRPLEEVIERVASNLRKYGEIIENNSYKNVPEGFRASIGMEYEITSSTAKGYEELTSQTSLKEDIARISQAARIGSGKDAVHEIATKPTDNPYLMLLEMKLLHDIEYIDLNFNRSENYQKGARGFHLTIGGEKGLTVDSETNFLQNALLAASWGGIQSGETGHKVNGGRGVSLRGRDAEQSNNIAFFGKKTNSVELRSLSIDKEETLQRAVTTAFNGAIAIQAFKECFPRGSSEVLNLLETTDGQRSIDEAIDSKDKKIADLARLWLDLISQVNSSVKRHNESFIDNEMFGYLDDKDVWVDAADFGGEYNKKRFDSIIANIDPTLSLKEYAKTTEINREEFFKSFSVELSDKLIKINNLYLKPGTVSADDKDKKTNVFKGDHANAISMLETTKLGNSGIEYYDEDFLDKTVFDTAGEKRKGYYYLQGGSELMLTHAIQKSLIDFNSKIEKMLN
ncbi:MAG: hypothetical protein WC467_00380 [Patescibacteria group bacterium]